MTFVSFFQCVLGLPKQTSSVVVKFAYLRSNKLNKKSRKLRPIYTNTYQISKIDLRLLLFQCVPGLP